MCWVVLVCVDVLFVCVCRDLRLRQMVLRLFGVVFVCACVFGVVFGILCGGGMSVELVGVVCVVLLC